MALQETGVSLVADNERGFLNALERADRAVSGFGDAAGRAASGGIDALSAASVAAGTVIGGVLFSALEKGAEAVAGFVGGTISKAGEFEATLNRFASVTGDAITEAGLSIGDFSDLFLKMGAVTQFSAGEAAEAAVELAKGGLDPLTIAAGGLEGALSLAAAGELDLAEAAEIAAKQLGVWGDQGVKAADVADLMAQAANASTVNVDDLALGMANVGGVAKGVGASFEETVTMLALLAPGFGSASDAGTSLKTFFNSLIPTTDKATEAMEELGLWTEEAGSAFFDAEGNFIGAAETSRLLYEATKDLSEAERSLALETIFGSDAQRAALGIAQAGVPGYEAMAAAMEAAGTAAEQAAERNKGWEFALESLRGSLDTVQTIIGLELIPVITDFINTSVIPAVNWIGEFATKIFESTDPLATFTQGINDIIPGFAGAMEALQPFIDVIAGMIGWVQQGQEIVPAFFLSVHDVLSDFLPEEVSARVWSFFNSLMNLQTAITEGNWSEAFQHITDAARQAFELLKPYAEEAFNKAIAWVQAQLPVWTEQLAIWGREAWEWLQEAIPPLLEEAGKLTARVIAWIQERLPGWIEQLEKWGREAWEWLMEAIPLLLEQAGEWGAQLLAFLADNLPEWIAQLLEWGKEAAEWLGEAIPPLLEKAGVFLADLIRWAGEEVLPALVEQALEWAEALYDWVTTELIPKIGPKLLDFLAEATRVMNEELLPAFYRAAGDIGRGIIDGIAGAIRGAGSAILDALGGVVDSAIQAIKDRLGISSPSLVFAMEIGAPIMEGITMGLEAAAPGFTSSLMAAVSPPRRAAQIVNNSYTYNTTTSFTGHYGSQAGIRDRSDLAWLVARGA